MMAAVLWSDAVNLIFIIKTKACHHGSCAMVGYSE